MIALPVYQSEERLTLVPSHRSLDPYFGMSPDELEQEYMRYAMQLIDTLDHSPHLPLHIRDQSAAFYTNELDKIDRRIQRYRRDARLKYRWPDRSRYESLGQLGQEMKQRYPLERFVADHLPISGIRKAGTSWLGRCPIGTHPDITPSFHVYDSIRFYCFGCEKHGDIFELIGLVYGIEGFADRIEYLAEVMS